MYTQDHRYETHTFCTERVLALSPALRSTVIEIYLSTYANPMRIAGRLIQSRSSTKPEPMISTAAARAASMSPAVALGLGAAASAGAAVAADEPAALTLWWSRATSSCFSTHPTWSTRRSTNALLISLMLMAAISPAVKGRGGGRGGG